VPSGAVDELLALLAAQADTYERLLSFAEQRLAALVAADVDQLDALGTREQPLLARARQLEDARRATMRPWADRLGVDVDDVTAGEIGGLVDALAAAALETARHHLRATVARLAAANTRNAGLLQACLDSTNASIRHLLQASQFDPRYAANGAQADPPAASRLTDLRA
jgi:flagellar biosynthesis/type III secretory pathway chaperone